MKVRPEAALCAFILLAPAVCFASGAAREFVAEVTTVDGDKTSRGTVTIAPDKMRMELADMVIITRLDLDKSWLFLPGERAYIEQTIDRKFVTSSSEKLRNETGREFLGDETIGGRDAAKYKVTYKDPAGTAVVFQWIASDIGFPVKTSAEDGSWSVTYTNVRAAPADASAFEIPAGYIEAEAPHIPVVTDHAEMNDD